MYLFLSNAVMKTRKDFPGNFARFPLPCVVSSRGRNTPQSWQKPRPLRQRYQQKPTQRKPQSKFLPRCQNPQFCGFAPRGKLVGECLPQTLLCALTGEKAEKRFCYFPKSCPMGGIEGFFFPNRKKVLLFPEKFSNRRGREISPPKVQKSCPIGGVRGKFLRPKSEKIQQ